jgi:hypothetical protein
MRIIREQDLGISVTGEVIFYHKARRSGAKTLLNACAG